MEMLIILGSSCVLGIAAGPDPFVNVPMALISSSTYEQGHRDPKRLVSPFDTKIMFSLNVDCYLENQDPQTCSRASRLMTA
jgi:hypothetical protein